MHACRSTLEDPTFLWLREELRLDVDGRYPQMTASGTVTAIGGAASWIAKLTATGPSSWTGAIWYKDGNTALIPQTNVKIVAVRSIFANLRRATVTFEGGGPTRTRQLPFTSASFHQVELEYDRTPDANPVAQIDTAAHPNRPASLPAETLTLEAVYRRAGFTVTKSGGDGVLPPAVTAAAGTWDENEMHDAMQAFWSRFDNKAQWSLWVFWAALAARGTGLGGIMFDDIGPQHRQGTAIFTESFIKDAPAGDPAPAAWVARMRFWTAAHEMGHAFNLAHAWQKSHPPTWGTSWIPLVNDPEARSFMNYPFNVAGGDNAFFADFAYRFIDPELLFLRHAPARFVQMGNAAWFDNHGFVSEESLPHPDLRLSIRSGRADDRFEFLEPVVLEAKLTNTGTTPQLVDRHLLDPGHGMTVVITRRGAPARQWAPYARSCLKPEVIVLQPGESLYAPLPIYAGVNGWDVADPGAHEVHVALNVDQAYAVAGPRRVVIDPPSTRDQERLASDVFTEDVGRTLAFGGSMVLTKATDTLRKVTEAAPASRAAIHARVALAGPATRAYKELVMPDGDRSMAAAGDTKRAVRVHEADPAQAAALLGAALETDRQAAAETIGHIDYRRGVDLLSSVLADQGDAAGAARQQAEMVQVFKDRQVLPSVVEDVERRQQAYEAAAGPAGGRGGKRR